VEGIVGVDLSRADLFPISVLAGRLPKPSSRTEVAVTVSYLRDVGVDPKKPVPVLGTELQLAEAQFLGQTFEQGVFSRWIRATVVGVVAQEAGSGEVLVPIQQVQRAIGFSGESPGYSAILVDARTLDRVGPLHDTLEAMGYSASAPENFIATIQRYLHVVEIVLAAIGIIALVIAAIGITNALLAAVRERRQEIGVLKAIGARDRDVLRVFMVEAGIVGFIGGVLGVAAGWTIARIVATVVNRYMVQQGLAGVRLGSPWPIMVGGLLVSVLLSLIAGAVPAIRAARLPAREAMGSA
jgi:putative ABC transport system permease protein